MAKILMIKSVLAYGGISKVTVKLSNELSKRHKVHIVNINGTTDSETIGLSKNVQVADVNVDKKNVKKSFLSISKKVRHYIKKNNFDIVLGMGTNTNLVLILATLGLNTKTIAADHNSIISGEYLGRFYRLQRLIGTKFSDRSVVLTEETLRDFMEKYKVPEKHFKVIYNWIDDDNVYLNDLNSRSIITAGRFEIQKGYDFLLPIAKRVLNDQPDWTWHICGDGNDDIKKQIENYIKTNKLENRLILEGVVTNMGDMYKQSEIYVMTSRYEGLPLVLLEAKQYGLPIVSYNCKTGPSEIIRDGVNGFLVEQYKEDEMVRKINTLIENKSLRKNFSKAAGKDIEKFQRDAIISQWESLFDEILNA